MATMGPQHRRGASLIGPLILIAAGILFLLANLGLLPAGFWGAIWRFWPVILILLGLDIILSRQLGWSSSITTAIIVVLIVLVVAAGLFGATTGTFRGLPPGIGFGPGMAGSGNVVSQPRDVQGFNQVEVAGPFRVDIVQSGTFTVTVSADDNIIDHIQTAADGGRLRIYLDTPVRSTGATLRASVGMPAISALALSGAAQSTVNGFQTPADLTVDMSGASRLTGQIQALNARIGASGASSATLQGTANSLILNGSGASSLDMGALQTSDAQVNLSGASNATVNARGRLDVTVTGASRLTYTGNPTLGTTNVSGGSSLNQR